MKYKDTYIGQRVVWLGEKAGGCYPSGIKPGATGTVVLIMPDGGGYCIGVEWDEYVGGHGCSGRAQDGHGYVMYPKSIDPINEMPDEIKVTFDDMFEGSK